MPAVSALASIQLLGYILAGSRSERQEFGNSGDRRVDALVFEPITIPHCRRQWAIEQATGDWPRSAILHKAARLRGLDFRIDRLNRREDGYFR